MNQPSPLDRRDLTPPADRWNDQTAEQPSTGRHGHLWRSVGGVGLHAPAATLTYDHEGRVCCHLCGRWFRSLGSHVRSHGHTAESYREEMGLCRTRSLSSVDASACIAERQRSAYESSPQVRERLAVGQAMACEGELTRRRINLTQEPRPERAELWNRQLAEGRATTAARRSGALSSLLQHHGGVDLGDFLTREYAAGASLDTLAAVTGLGRERLRREMDLAGVRVRATGANTPDGKRSRARRAEAAAAARVGTDDLRAWLALRREAGWTLSRLAEAVGHSGPWVRARLPEEVTRSVAR